MTRSNLIWVSVVVVLAVGSLVYLSLSNGSEKDRSTPGEAQKNSRSAASSKSTRRLDFRKAENRDGVLHGEDGKPFTGTLEKEHPGGGRSAEIPMREGVVDGTMKTFDENGTLRVRAKYENGRLVSREEWDEDGKKIDETGRDPYGEILAQRDAERQPNTPRGAWPELIPDSVAPTEGVDLGGLRERGGVSYHTETGQPYTGRALRRYSDGSEVVRNYLNGVPHGEFTSTHPNGQLQSKEFYVNGKQDGPYTRYYENGQLSYETEVVSGKQIGIATTWDEQGRVTSRFEFTEDGKRINLLAPTPTPVEKVATPFPEEPTLEDPPDPDPDPDPDPEEN